jgi:predicted nuclease of predicted toxin-antitoxin system
VGKADVRLFIDECLSPDLATRLNDTGRHDAIHPLHAGRRGQKDHVVLARCIEEDRIIVTENARDFRKLCARAAIHPGLILLPSIEKEGTWILLQAALRHLEALSPERPQDALVNHVLEIDENGAVAMRPLP